MIAAATVPVCAIGGVTPDNIGQVRSASGACIMSGFMTCADVTDFMRRLRAGALLR